MSRITRRRFGALLGLVAANGTLRSLYAQSKGDAKAETHAATAPPKPAPASAPAKVPGSASTVNRETASPETIWADLMAGNKRYVTGKTAARDVVHERAETVKTQHPYVTVLCCSDSRVSPELIFDQSIGDLFVVRTAGNVADSIAIASLEYAADHLNSRMLVVLGHENCGAVSTALSGEAQPSENLTALMKKIRPGVDRLKDLVTGDALMALAVEANVHHSAADVLENSAILRHGVASGDLTIVKALYKMSTGEVSALNKIYESI
jgi:carbonic anhydrase